MEITMSEGSKNYICIRDEGGKHYIQMACK